MANITSSTFQAFIQKDGSKTVHEIHTDFVGLTHDLTYAVSNGADLNVNLAQHAVDIGDALDKGEVQANISAVLAFGSLAAPTLVYSTAGTNFAALRVAYLSATQFQAVMIGDYLNTLTNGQLATAFGITTGQAGTLRTNKLAPAAALATSIRATVGQ